MTSTFKTRLTAVTLAATMLGGVAFATPALADRDRGFFSPRTAVTEQMNRIARDHGYGEVVYVEQKKKHVKGYTRDGAGNTVEIKLDRWGNLDEIEVEYGWRSRGWGAHAGEAEIRRNIEQAGYRMLHLTDRKKNHYEIMAENGNGDVVELHVDFSGQVYKSKLKPMEFGALGFGNDRGFLGDRGERPSPRGSAAPAR
jgi:hypothetical protein